MKAKVIATGEILKIADYATIKMDACDSWGNPLEFKPEEIELLYEETTQNNEIDWEQRRFELVKEVVQGMCANSEMLHSYKTILSDKMELEEYYMRSAFRVADAVIAKLKEG